ncbi:UNVERIFIED_CONTAM: hypothetical protein RMT77_012662 [Armadillidium vulgare]
MKIPADEMKFILRPSVQILQNIFIKHKYEIRITGGAVRDLLMNKIPVDLDFATTATPSEMKNMFISEGIKITNRYGEKHATVTACIKEENFECSTLRVDKIIDGTRKEVEFSYDWEQDANAGRDFTINALFLSFDGTIYDYVNGIQHIKERKIKFVGNPDETIQANPHRILRYFRFFGMLTDDPNKHDPEAIESIIRNRDRLSEVSPEVVKKELKKILIGKYNYEMLLKMIDCGLGPHIGLSHEFDCENVMKVHKTLKDTNYHYCLLLIAGLKSEEELAPFFNRAQFSRNERQMFHFFIKYRNVFFNIQTLKEIRDILIEFVYKDEIENKKREIVDKNKRKIIDRRNFALELSKQFLLYVGRSDLLGEVNETLIPYFPIRRNLLVNKGDETFIQSEMLRVFKLWKESGYILNRNELLNKLNLL